MTILLLATISIICAVLFAACNNGNATQKDTYSITLSHDDTETPLVKINTTGNYDMNAIEKGSSITFSVELRNDYDPSTLKIFSNDKEGVQANKHERLFIFLKNAFLTYFIFFHYHIELSNAFSLEEYEEYLDFLEMKRAKKRDFEM